MKLKTLLTFAASLAAGASLAMADDTPLGKEMSAMNKALRTLKRQVADPAKKAENLALVDDMKKRVEASAKYEPAKTKDQPAADKPKYLEDYKAQIADLGKAIDELRAAVDKGDATAVQAVFDKLSDIKEKGHQKFSPDE
jgi:soluble cytochrome b562